jgi:hypothetical protein
MADYAAHSRIPPLVEVELSRRREGMRRWIT